jgi:hypothetical protein
MLTLQVNNGDRLEFQFEATGETRRVVSERFGKGEMLLLQPEPGTWFLKPLALLKESKSKAIWPEVQLRYYEDKKGIWKVAFDLPDTVKVERKKAH